MKNFSSVVPKAEKEIAGLGWIGKSFQLVALVGFVFVLLVNLQQMFELEGFIAQVAPERPPVRMQDFVVILRLVPVGECQVANFAVEDFSRRGVSLQVHLKDLFCCESFITNGTSGRV